MKKLFIFAAVLSLSACDPAVGISDSVPVAQGSSISVAGNKVILEGTRGLLLAHNAYQGAAYAVAPLVRTGKLPAETVNRIEVLNEKAIALLRGADSTQSIASRSANLFAIADELLKLGGK